MNFDGASSHNPFLLSQLYTRSLEIRNCTTSLYNKVLVNEANSNNLYSTFLQIQFYLLIKPGIHAYVHTGAL